MRSVSFICVILVILLAGAITFHRLGDASIRLDSDEVIHARVTQEMHQSSAYFAPTHGGYPYWQKPPLSMWMSTAALRWFGENNFGFRAGSAVCGFALFLLIPLLSQRLFGGSPLPGVIAILVLLGSRTLILGEHGIRTATPDASLLLLTVAAMLCLWSALAAPATASLALSWLGVGVFTGLAVYSKSVVGFLPFCVMVALAALPKSVTGIARERIVLRNVVVACFLGITIPATYFLPHCLFSDDACRKFFVGEIYNRAVDGYHNRREVLFYYHQLFTRGELATPAILTLSLLLAAVQWWKTRSTALLFLLVWGIVPPLLLSVPRSRLPWYIAPSFPALALIVGFTVTEIARYGSRRLREDRSSRLFGMAVLAACSFALLLIARDTVAVATRVHVGGKRLMIDRAIEEITSFGSSRGEQFAVGLAEDAISLSANPKRATFNVEAIYLRSMGSRLESLPPQSDLGFFATQRPEGFVILRQNDPRRPAFAAQFRCSLTIPAYRVRGEPVTLFALAEEFSPRHGPYALPWRGCRESAL